VGNNSGLDPEWDENTANQKTMVGPYLSPSNTGPQNYQLFSFTETASSTVTRLDFHGIDQNGSILLDNVMVSPLMPGDLNRDGQVNVADVLAMEQALIDLPAYQAANGLSAAQLLLLGNLDGDGAVTNADLQGLITLLANGGGSGSLTAVPEPGAIVLLLTALPAIVFVASRSLLSGRRRIART
jgi:hypothetical protein